MEDGDVLKFLRCPSSRLVDLAIELANLTWKENTAILLCGRQGKTQEAAAQQSGYSVDAVQKWYRAGMQKLSTAWSGVWWIKKIIE